MPKQFFRFKQFSIAQDRCSMKVGTDAVLLGAWVDVRNAKHILDIGTGTGVIALMLAQRSTAFITGIDIVEEAVEQAKENIASSLWHDRIEILRADARDFGQEEKQSFDLIVANPPYHTEQVKSPDAVRDMARHVDSLSFSQLLATVERLLSADGTFSVVLPVSAASEFIGIALQQRLYLSKRLSVHGRVGKPAKRVLLSFTRRNDSNCENEELYIETSPGVRTSEYDELTKPYYLT